MAFGTDSTSRDRRQTAPSVITFVPYACGVFLLAAAVIGWLAATSHLRLDAGPAAFWLLAAFVLIGELLPIEVPRRGTHDMVTVSTAFAFALLLSFGLGPAIAVYAVSSVLVDLRDHKPAVKVAFNAAHYSLSVVAAAGVLALTGEPPPVHSISHALPDILLAGAAWFGVNHVLAATGAALLTRCPILRYLSGGLVYQGRTAGFLLSLAPLVVVSAQATPILIPLSFLPMLAIYLEGREAAINEHGASHDSLTHLPNRSLLRHRLDLALSAATRRGLSVVVLLLDLDDFKAVNDTLGHHHGDILLTQVAPRLRTALREKDTLARLGGDEFAVLLEDVNGPTDGVELAQRILAVLEQPFELDSLSVDVRASVGIACFPQDGTDADELLQHADAALYAAKDSELPYRVYAAEYDEHSLDRLGLATDLRRGIERGELVLHYQPKVALREGQPHGVEVLVRWRHPNLGLIGPNAFIPVAEHTGLIKPLTDYVLDGALRQRKEWGDAGLKVRMSVNVSTRSLLDRRLATRIDRLLRKYELPPEAIQLEITESKVVADLRRARAVLEELRAMGVAIAIDDFGTGFSSLSQLQQLPVDEIKIDRSFVTSFDKSASNAAIVRSTIDLGRNLSLHVTAEGVESDQICQVLAGLGCDYAQGFALSRPQPAAECQRELRRHMAINRSLNGDGPAGPPPVDIPAEQMGTAA